MPKKLVTIALAGLAALTLSCDDGSSPVEPEGPTPPAGPPQLSAHPANPVLPYGPAGSWDAGLIYIPEVLVDDGTHYLFYTGTADLLAFPTALGFATSDDGVTWTRHPANPVFTADGTGFDAFMVAEGRVVVDGLTWTLYYNARGVPGPGPGPAIGRATAPSPAGPWTRSETPVLEVGPPGAWDAGFVTPNTVLRVDDGYVMYYSGGTAFPFPPDDHAMLGMATSPDGITWTKYDDSSTTAAPFAESDPVLVLGPAGSFDSGLAWEASVLRTVRGWEMFYTSDPDTWTGERISYATSEDGIRWVKAEGNPIFGEMQGWASLDLIVGSVVEDDGEYRLYYVGNTSLFDGQVGLATGSVPR